MCDKVRLENGYFLDSKEKMEETFEEQLGAKIVFVPWDYEDEPYGHADGYVAYLGGNKVLMSNCREYNPCFADRLKQALVEKGGFEVTELTLKNESENDWVYINYVRYKDIILMPALGLKGDEEAREIIAEANNMPIDKVRMITLPRSLVNYGGALHCCTWNSDGYYETAFLGPEGIQIEITVVSQLVSFSLSDSATNDDTSAISCRMSLPWSVSVMMRWRWSLQL